MRVRGFLYPHYTTPPPFPVVREAQFGPGYGGRGAKVPWRKLGIVGPPGGLSTAWGSLLNRSPSAELATRAGIGYNAAGPGCCTGSPGRCRRYGGSARELSAGLQAVTRSWGLGFGSGRFVWGMSRGVILPANRQAVKRWPAQPVFFVRLPGALRAPLQGVSDA